MMAFTGEGQVLPELVAERDARCGISTAGKPRFFLIYFCPFLKEGRGKVISQACPMAGPWAADVVPCSDGVSGMGKTYGGRLGGVLLGSREGRTASAQLLMVLRGTWTGPWMRSSSLRCHQTSRPKLPAGQERSWVSPVGHALEEEALLVSVGRHRRPAMVCTVNLWATTKRAPSTAVPPSLLLQRRARSVGRSWSGRPAPTRQLTTGRAARRGRRPWSR